MSTLGTDETPNTPSAHDVFISHMRAHNGVAVQLVNELRLAGLSVWSDDMSLRPGDAWSKPVDQAIATSRAIVVLVARGMGGTDEARRAELTTIEARGQSGHALVIPVLLPHARIDNVPLVLRRFQGLALRTSQDVDSVARSIIASLRSIGRSTDDQDVSYLADELRAYESARGAHDLETMAARSNLAHKLVQVGDIDGAIRCFQELAADQADALGPGHPDLLITRNSLASAYSSADRTGEAAALLEQTLSDSQRILGSDHPSTLTARANLASIYRDLGRTSEAAALLEQTLSDSQRILGSDHPSTLTTRSNLAYWRGQAGDLAGAAAASEGLLADMLRVLGPDHPDTLTTRSNLAYWRGQAGDVEAAVTAFEDLLVDQLRVLGRDHPSTLVTRSNLAYWRGQAGDVEAAVTAFEDLLVDQLRVLGRDHPTTLSTERRLELTRREAYERE